MLREDREPRLADAQRSVANELGFPSWPALVAHVAARPPALRRDLALHPVLRRRCDELLERLDEAHRA